MNWLIIAAWAIDSIAVGLVLYFGTKIIIRNLK